MPALAGKVCLNSRALFILFCFNAKIAGPADIKKSLGPVRTLQTPRPGPLHLLVEGHTQVAVHDRPVPHRGCVGQRELRKLPFMASVQLLVYRRTMQQGPRTSYGSQMNSPPAQHPPCTRPRHTGLCQRDTGSRARRACRSHIAPAGRVPGELRRGGHLGHVCK